MFSSYHYGRPLISICIPTFNRVSCLENLLNNLEGVKTAYGDEVEICISNNQSTDSTLQIIEIWREKLALKVATQQKNIGFTLNGIEVTRLATGRWILIIGDDDELIFSNFKKLMVLLQSADERDWILAGVADKSEKEHLFGDLKAGRYKAKSFRIVVLRTGLYRFGFLGMHIFPSVLLPQYLSFSFNPKAWPHIALFLQHLQSGKFLVFSAPIVKQAAVGDKLFWASGDWVCINLKKLDIIVYLRGTIKSFRWYFDCLLLRELYSLRNIKELVLWKALEPFDFYRKAFSEFIRRYVLIGLPMFLASGIHCIFLSVIYAIPSRVFRIMLFIIGKGNLVFDYSAKKKVMSSFDGIERGL